MTNVALRNYIGTKLLRKFQIQIYDDLKWIITGFTKYMLPSKQKLSKEFQILNYFDKSALLIAQAVACSMRLSGTLTRVGNQNQNPLSKSQTVKWAFNINRLPLTFGRRMPVQHSSQWDTRLIYFYTHHLLNQAKRETSFL